MELICCYTRKTFKTDRFWLTSLSPFIIDTFLASFDGKDLKMLMDYLNLTLQLNSSSLFFFPEPLWFCIWTVSYETDRWKNRLALGGFFESDKSTERIIIIDWTVGNRKWPKLIWPKCSSLRPCFINNARRSREVRPLIGTSTNVSLMHRNCYHYHPSTAPQTASTWKSACTINIKVGVGHQLTFPILRTNIFWEKSPKR